MNSCPRCGYTNTDAEAFCVRCGQALPERPIVELPTGVGIMSERPPQRDDARVRARWFLSVATLGGLLIVGPLLILVLFSPRISSTSLVSSETLWVVFWAVFVPSTWLYLAFLISQTARVTGVNPWVAFALALVPPCWPAVWARMGERSVYLPYLALLADVLVLSVAWVCGVLWPWLPPIAFLTLSPLLVHHLFGRSIDALAPVLGLGAWLSTIWCCMAPLFFVALYLGDVEEAMLATTPEFILMMGEALRGSGEAWAKIWAPMPTIRMFHTGLLVYITATFAFWIAGIYDDLKMPTR